MHRQFAVAFLLVSLSMASHFARAVDDAAAVAAKAQSAWLRGADAELAALAAANTRWAASAAADESYAYAFVQFRSLQSLLARKNEDAASKAGEACVLAAGKAAGSAKTGALAAEAWALQSTCYGYLAGLGGTFAAIRNGRASGKAMEQALAIDARNARVLLVDAFGLYFRPKIAGGDKLKACARFRESSAAFDRLGAANNSGSGGSAGLAPLGGWGAAEAHFWVGRCLLDAKDASGARGEFEQAVKRAPEFAAAQRALRR